MFARRRTVAENNMAQDNISTSTAVIVPFVGTILAAIFARKFLPAILESLLPLLPLVILGLAGLWLWSSRQEVSSKEQTAVPAGGNAGKNQSRFNPMSYIKAQGAAPTGMPPSPKAAVQPVQGPATPLTPPATTVKPVQIPSTPPTSFQRPVQAIDLREMQAAPAPASISSKDPAHGAASPASGEVRPPQAPIDSVVDAPFYTPLGEGVLPRPVAPSPTLAPAPPISSAPAAQQADTLGPLGEHAQLDGESEEDVDDAENTENTGKPKRRRKGLRKTISNMLHKSHS